MSAACQGRRRYATAEQIGSRGLPCATFTLTAKVSVKK